MVWILCICLIVLGFLLFLYLTLRHDIKNLGYQLKYVKEEKSTFPMYSTSYHHSMKVVIDEINQMRNALEEEHNMYICNDQNIRDMITNITHDIRTPLTSIGGYVQMLQVTQDEERKAYYYQIITQRLQDLECMLDEFFIYTKLISKNETLECEEKEIYPILCASILSYYEQLKKVGIAPLLICEDESIKANLHEESLRRISMNLIMNVIRYGSAPFQIVIENHHDGVELCFKNKVKANCTLDIEHMFDRFYKGDMARSQVGSGLGLAIVKELCQQCNALLFANVQEDTLSIHIKFQK